MKLSIIVPIYNVEQYLRRCVDSILAQTFTDFELILVDDGSPDNCPAICDEYAKKDSRIIVIHKENGGLADARNAGLDIARGDYIGFVDSDDYIHPQMYDHMINRLVESNADFAACGMQYIDNTERNFGSWPPKSQDILFSRNDFIEHYYPDVRRTLMTSVCNKLFRAKSFEKLRFPKGKTYEDGMIQLDIYDQCNSIVVLKEYYYYYFCVREDSIINSSYSIKQFDSIELALKQYVYFENLGIREQQHYTLSVYVNNYLANWFAVKIKARELFGNFVSYKKEFNKYYFRIYANPKICRLKKLVVLIHRALPKIAYKICRKYFPECLHESMK